MNKILLISIILGATLVSIVGYAYYTYYYLPNYYYQQSLYYYNHQLGMMGYGGMMMSGSMMGGYANFQQIPIGENYTHAENSSYVKILPSNDSIIFYTEDINLVVLSMGHTRAYNLTHYIPPSNMHAEDNVFVIDGLINPTLVIPQGAIVHITLINLDEGDYHNIAITPLSPPYPYYVMMYVRMNILTMTPMLPPANYNSGYAYSFSSNVVFYNAGTYYYICEYPGHAEMGMYGEIIIYG